MSFSKSHIKVGVYVDVSNMYRNGGQKMRYDVLREFACRGSAEPVRLNAYVSFDARRAAKDVDYQSGAMSFHSALRDLGYKVIVKEVKWFQDESGESVAKANADLELAVDALLQSENLDRVLIASGDGDFVQVVRALQNKGCRVEVIALKNVSRDLRQEADMFMSGFLIPNLIPTATSRWQAWSETGSRVRGWCYWHHTQQSYGFIRYLREVTPGLWLTDTRHPDSPYTSVFFHDSDLPDGVEASSLPNRNLVFEFELSESERGEGVQASNIELISER